jgi:ABC-2 type transport system ATP-binding protein
MAALVQADDVRVEFGSLVAVDRVSLTLYPGDLVGLIGPNGAGKTTLLRVLAGLQPLTCGQVRIMGQDIEKDSEAVRGRVAFAPDSPPAYEDMTVENFLLFVAQCHDLPRREAHERVDFWLERVWLKDKRAQLIRTLSRGMRQRVTVAQTLLPNPSVVLLDEPSSGLDPAGRIQLREIIGSLRQQGKATIVSSHILADLEDYCTHIAIIEHGRVLRFAHVRELHELDAPRQDYRLTVADGLLTAEALQSIPGVGRVLHHDGVYTLEYEAGPAGAVRLLRELVQRGFAVTSFAAQRASLEDVYLKTGVKQVD